MNTPTPLQPLAGTLATPEPTTKEVRAWALAHGLDVSDRGRLRPHVWEAYRRAMVQE